MNDCDRFDMSTIFSVFQEAANMQKRCVQTLILDCHPNKIKIDGRVRIIILASFMTNALNPYHQQTK